MFRNGLSRTQTQTQLPPISFTGNSNTLGTSTQVNSTSSDDEIMFAIVTGNISSVRRLVTSSNVNKIIDKKNNYTALHHAVRIRRNDDIIEYLLSIGANPLLKQNEQKDAIDLSIESNYRYLIDKMLKEKETELDKIYTKFDEVNYGYKNLERKNKELTEENTYLKKSAEQYVEKIEELKTENVSLKRKYDDSEKAFANLLKKTKK
jgi:ankyrin repeat protein